MREEKQLGARYSHCCPAALGRRLAHRCLCPSQCRTSNPVAGTEGWRRDTAAPSALKGPLFLFAPVEDNVLWRELQQGETGRRTLWYELAIEVHRSQKGESFFCIMGCTHLLDCFYAEIVRPNALGTYLVTQHINLRPGKAHFADAHPKICFILDLKHGFKIFKVLVHVPAIHSKIINACRSAFWLQLLEQDIDDLLEHGARGLEAQQEDFPLGQALWREERKNLTGILVKQQLVIALGEIQGCKHCAASQSVQIVLNPVHWVSVAENVVIDHLEVYAHTEQPIRLVHAHHGQGIRQYALLNETAIFILLISALMAAMTAGKQQGI